jgi:hypothetical protein
MPVEDYTPTVADVGSIDMARTVDDVGTETGTFSDPDGLGRGGTRPTAAQVALLIARSINDVAPKLGTDIPVDLQDDATQLVALRTAMWIELTYFASEVAQDRSPYPQYKALFDEAFANLIGAIQAEESGEDPKDDLSPKHPQFSFPDPIDIMTRPF